MVVKNKKKGTMVIELIWLASFVMSFLASVIYLYDKSEKIIEKHRVGRIVNNDKLKFPEH